MPCDRNLTSNNKKTQGKSEHLRDRGCDDPVAFVEDDSRSILVDSWTRGHLYFKRDRVFSVPCTSRLDARYSIYLPLMKHLPFSLLLFFSSSFFCFSLQRKEEEKKKKEKIRTNQRG